MENEPKFRPDPSLKLMEQVRQVLRYHHYAYSTEKTYCDWIVRYIKQFGSKTHPQDMGKVEIDAFLSHLAVEGRVSAATQRQALNAIIFLYRSESTPMQPRSFAGSMCSQPKIVALTRIPGLRAVITCWNQACKRP